MTDVQIGDWILSKELVPTIKLVSNIQIPVKYTHLDLFIGIYSIFVCSFVALLIWLPRSKMIVSKASLSVAGKLWNHGGKSAFSTRTTTSTASTTFGFRNAPSHRLAVRAFVTATSNNNSRNSCLVRSDHASQRLSASHNNQVKHFSTTTIASNTPILGDKLQDLLKAPPLLLGCVCYDPAVYDIWSGIKDYLEKEAGVPFDYVLYTNYEQQVASLLQRQIDVAWNGPLAHVLLEQAASASSGQEVVSLGMRDVDRDFQSIVVVQKSAQIVEANDLKGRHVLTGAPDSPQAHVVPLHYLQSVLGVQLGSVSALDYDLGKHGDTALGEIKAMELLLMDDNTAEVAVLSKMMWDRACQGLLPSVDATRLQEEYTVLDSVNIPPFDHCQFDAILFEQDPPSRKDKLENFAKALFAMQMDNPNHKHLMCLEGIQKQWEGPRQTGYDIVRNAMIPKGMASHRSATNFQLQQKRSYASTSKRFHSTSTTAAAAAASSSSSDKPMRVAVIGAGVAGLQAIRSLQAQHDHLQVTAFEAGPTVGGLWKENYSNFGIQAPRQLFEFQDFPMTEASRGEFASGKKVQSYIEKYADTFGLRKSIQFNTKVTKANNSSGTWKIQTTSTVDQKTVDHEFDYLVVATGLYSSLKQYLPDIPGQKTFQDKGGDILHSSQFYDASVSKDKRVVVVGSGKSAVDCAIEASKAGASAVTLLQRTPHWPTPQYIAGVIPFQHIFLSRFGQALVSTHVGTFPGGSGPVINAFRNSGIGPLLMKPVFRIVEALFAFQFGLSGDLRPKADVVADFYRVALVLNSDLKDLRKAGKIDVRLGEVEKFGDDGKEVLLKDGASLDTDMVVCATGFEQDYSMFADDPKTLKDLDLQDDGFYLYRTILPEKIPNLAFIGHNAAISNISSYGIQAEWLARYLTNQLSETPTPESMSQDIQARKEWARSWMPYSSTRGMNVLLHQTHYHDQLLRDMGENPLRKSNPLSEYLMPYESADYNGIMGGSPVTPVTAAA